MKSPSKTILSLILLVFVSSRGQSGDDGMLPSKSLQKMLPNETNFGTSLFVSNIVQVKDSESSSHFDDFRATDRMEKQFEKCAERRLYKEKQAKPGDKYDGVVVHNFLSAYRKQGTAETNSSKSAKNTKERNKSTKFTEKSIEPEKSKRKKNSKKSKSKRRLYKNVCLEPLDHFRTCYQRSSDPTNRLKRDEILRNEYNYGAYLEKKNRRKRNNFYNNSSKSSKKGLIPLQPYTPPFIRRDEELISSTFYLALNRDSTTISCDDIISMEEVVLEFLKDNVGNDDTFSPLCVSSPICISEGDYPEGSTDFIETTACQVDVYYWIKKKYKNKIDGQRLLEVRSNEKKESSDDKSGQLKNICSSSERPLCCSGNAINGSRNSKFCKESGCGHRKCPRKRRARNNSRTLSIETRDEAAHQFAYGDRKLEPYIDIPNNLFKTDFNTILNIYTDFQPEKTKAVMGAVDVSDVAICSTYRFIEDNYEDPFDCMDYERFEDIIFEENEKICQDELTTTSSSPPWEYWTSTTTYYPTATYFY